MADLVREIMIDATPETVFAYITDTEKHLEWEGTEAELDARPGGAYRVLVGGQWEAIGEYVEVIASQRVVLKMGVAGDDVPNAPGTTTVTYELIAEGDKTLLRVTQTGLSDDKIADHTTGWDFYLSRLAIVAAGGKVAPDV